MVILFPWKTIVVIWLVLSAMLWCGYVGSSVMEGKNPFPRTPSTGVAFAARFAPRFITHIHINPESPADCNPRSLPTRVRRQKRTTITGFRRPGFATRGRR
jgi:hypothetical protein